MLVCVILASMHVDVVQVHTVLQLEEISSQVRAVRTLHSMDQFAVYIIHYAQHVEGYFTKGESRSFLFQIHTDITKMISQPDMVPRVCIAGQRHP
jgi:hypothetical protein